MHVSERIWRCALACLAVVVAVAPGALAQELPFRDEFDDGSPWDGEPVAWAVGYGNQDTWEVTDDGDLLLDRTKGGQLSTVRVVGGSTLPGNVSLRTQFRFDGRSSGAPFIWARGTGTFSTYWGGVYSSGQIEVGESLENGGISVRGSTPSGLRPVQEDVVLRLDLFGSRVSLKAWRPNDPEPDQPQVAFYDERLTSGDFGLAMGATSPESAVFRWFEALPLPDALAGDVNLDGAVDLSDFGTLKTNFGRTNRRRWQGDLTSDKTVDLSDFGLLKEDFGKTAFAPVAVPEPKTLLLACLGLMALLFSAIPYHLARCSRKGPRTETGA